LLALISKDKIPFQFLQKKGPERHPRAWCLSKTEFLSLASAHASGSRSQGEVLDGDAFDTAFAPEGEFVFALFEFDGDRFRFFPHSDGEGQVDVDRLFGSVDVEEDVLPPARGDDARGQLIRASGGGLEGVSEGLVSAGAAVVKLLAAKNAVEEEDFAGALGGLAGGRRRDGDDAF